MENDNPGLHQDHYMASAPLSFLPSESEGPSILSSSPPLLQQQQQQQQQQPSKGAAANSSLGYYFSSATASQVGSEISLRQCSIGNATHNVSSQGLSNGNVPAMLPITNPNRVDVIEVQPHEATNGANAGEEMSGPVVGGSSGPGTMVNSSGNRPDASQISEVPIGGSALGHVPADTILTGADVTGAQSVDEQLQVTAGESTGAATDDEVNRRSIFVGNVDYGSTPPDLQEHFKACGTINRITILVDRYTGHPKGFAYIEFQDEEAVASAMALHESLFRGRPLKVTPKRKNIPGLGSTTALGRRGGGPFTGGRGRGAASPGMLLRNGTPSRLSRRGACRMAIAGYNPSYRGRSGRGATPY